MTYTLGGNVEYTPEPNAGEPPYFEIDPNTGELIALKQLDYITDPHRYVVNVTATEDVTGNSTTQQVAAHKTEKSFTLQI